MRQWFSSSAAEICAISEILHRSDVAIIRTPRWRRNNGAAAQLDFSRRVSLVALVDDWQNSVDLLT